MYRLPPRQPVQDIVSGVVLRAFDRLFLASEPTPDAEVIASGSVAVRYGIVYLGRAYHAIMPELVALDTGGGFAGEEAWNFLFEQSNLFPRADVIGFREDGQEDMVTVKSLDLMYPVRAFAFHPADAPVNLGQLSALLGAVPAEWPARLTDALDAYPDLATYKAQHS
ncbi:hypothetical protein VZO05_07080 [Aggregatilineales bacterium SYSU G02658]